MLAKKQAFSNPTRQFTDADTAGPFRDMIGGSEKNAWMMLKYVPREDSDARQPHGCDRQV
eukprot:7332968-Karenia_brevis.AAC.1